jgi:hypothetical protein
LLFKHLPAFACLRAGKSCSRNAAEMQRNLQRKRSGISCLRFELGLKQPLSTGAPTARADADARVPGNVRIREPDRLLPSAAVRPSRGPLRRSEDKSQKPPHADNQPHALNRRVRPAARLARLQCLCQSDGTTYVPIGTIYVAETHGAVRSSLGESALRSRTRGCSGCRREKLRSRRVRLCPRATASSITPAARGSLACRCFSSSALPPITISGLLKSRATPPVG